MRLKLLIISLSIIGALTANAQVRKDIQRTGGALGHHVEESASKDIKKESKFVRPGTSGSEKKKITNGFDNFVISDKPTNLSIDRKKIGKYVLYRDVTRRYSWFEGVGEPITQETADKLPYYYRLSMKNKAGHYQFVEAMHGSALTSGHPKSPMIIDKFYNGDDDVKDWRTNLKSVGQWMLTSDLTGEEMIEERAYEAKEKDARLIYAFQCVKMDSIHVNGCYVTANGLPIDINESDSYNYGNLVRITYASDGTDSITEFYDSKGFFRPDDVGVYQRRYKHDDNLRMTEVSTHNLAGDYMNDATGLCRTTFTYDGDGEDYVAEQFDMNGNPFIPLDGVFEGISSHKARHDEFGRLIEITTLNGRINNATGKFICPARIEVTYSPTGEVLTTKYFDSDGEVMFTAE